MEEYNFQMETFTRATSGKAKWRVKVNSLVIEEMFTKATLRMGLSMERELSDIRMVSVTMKVIGTITRLRVKVA
jgi:hypothetical protein